MKALRIALISTGIGAIVVLLGEAAAAMTAFADETDDATDGVDGLSLALSRLNDTAEASVKGLNTTTQIVLEYAKQRGATEKELSDITKKSYLAEAEIYRRITDAKITEVQKFLKAVSPNTIIKSAGDAKAALDQLKFDKASGRFKDYTDQQTKQLEGIENTLQDIVTSNTAALDAMDKARLTSAQADTKIIEEQRANAKKLADERDKRRQDYIDRERKAQFELLKLEKEGEIKRLNNIATSQDFSFQDRIQARLDMYEAERSLAIAQKEFELKNDKLTASERELVIAQAAAKIKEIEQQSAKDIIAIRKSIREKEQADIAEALAYGESETEKGTQRQITSATKVFENNIKLIEDQAEEEARILLEKYTAGIIGKETYEAEKLALENRTRRASLLAEIEHQEKLIKIMILSPEAAAEAEKKLRALKKQLNAEDIKDTETKTAKEIELEQKKAELIKQLANEVKETTFALLTSGIDKEKNKIQDDIDALEQKKQKDIEVANQSITNAQDRAAAITSIEATAAAQREQLERRKRKLDEEKARWERNKNIGEIIANTARAVTETLPNIPLSILVGAIGAAQLVRVLTTQIPRYKDGTKNHPGGLAVVRDGGKSELVQLPTGETYTTPSKPTLTYLPKNTVVHPDAEALQAIAMRSIDRTMTMAAQMKQPNDRYQFQNMTSAITGKLDQLNRTIKNKTEVIVRTPSMRDVLFKDGNAFREYLNNSL